MTDLISADVVKLEPAQAAYRDYFLGWQCRLRQLAMRADSGRPNAGMRPSLMIEGAQLAQIVVLIFPHDAETHTAEFRHMVVRTQDAADRYLSALRKFEAGYYQHPADFSDRMTALFGPNSEIVSRLTSARRCRLVFDHQNQRFDLPCEVRKLAPQTTAYRATFWHNRLFNPNIPPRPQVLQFLPDWSRAEAEPAPP